MRVVRVSAARSKPGRRSPRTGEQRQFVALDVAEHGLQGVAEQEARDAHCDGHTVAPTRLRPGSAAVKSVPRRSEKGVTVRIPYRKRKPRISHSW